MLQRRAFHTSPWHSLKAALEDLSEDVFVWQPPRHTGFPWLNGSIRDIVYHVTGDKLIQINHAFGDSSLNWENVALSKAAKTKMLCDLRDAQDRVVQTLEERTEASLGDKVSSWGGKTMPADDLFLMLIEHDIYHAGQIRYIRNVAG